MGAPNLLPFTGKQGAPTLKLATHVVQSLLRIQRNKSQGLGLELNPGKPDALNRARPGYNGQGVFLTRPP